MRGDGRASLFHLAVSTPYSSEWLVLPPPAFNPVAVAASRIKSIDLSFFLWPVRLTSREGWIYPNCLPCLYIHHPSSAPRAAATSTALSSDGGWTSFLSLSRTAVSSRFSATPFFPRPSYSSKNLNYVSREKLFFMRLYVLNANDFLRVRSCHLLYEFPCESLNFN